jgi:hypothetical protein
MSTDRRVPNAFMWRGESRPFYQRWWLKFNTGSGETLSFQVGVNNPWDTEHRFHTTGSFIFFDRYSPVPENNLMSMPMWGIEAFRAETDRFEVELDGSTFSDERWQGAIYDAEHDKHIRFDLEIQAVEPFLLSDVGLDGIAQTRRANTLWQAPMADCRVSGTVEIDDEKIEFQNAPGYQDVFWGPAIPDRWFWANCNRFDEDPAAWFVLGGGEIEILGRKLPRFLSDSFPVLAALHVDGRTCSFNSVLNRAKFFFDKGEVRLDVRRRLRGLRVVYSSKVERKAVRPMDWHSPDDHILESGMQLLCPAKLEIYRGGLFRKWRLEKTLTTLDAGSICGGARLDAGSPENSFLGTLFVPIAQALFAGYYLLRGLLRFG